jgi:unsaturated rhamnogalacturonyl hydrolase
MIDVLLLTVALISTVDTDLRAVAALPGEPSIVSAGGITRRDTPISTLENPSPFDPADDRAAPRLKKRLVIIGGLDGDDATARSVIDAVRWIKTGAPAAVRRSWIVSAMPCARPDADAPPLAFPPEQRFFGDLQSPESRYVWRWLSYQAPDQVIVFASSGSTAAASLRRALAHDGAAGLGSAGVSEVEGSAAFRAWLAAAGGRTPRSRLHEALALRAGRTPVAIAQLLARRYPGNPAISYIPSVAWVNTLRLASITNDDGLRARVREQTGPWANGERPLFGDRIPLTAIAGTMIFADLAAAGAATRPLAERGAALALARKGDGALEYGQGWTDDMFMASSIVSRMTPGGAAALLVDYASRLQRPDGLFNHAASGPAAWGRGNGFAALGLVEALTTIRADAPERPRLLEVFRRHMNAVRDQQAPDGAWRQVIDEPGAYREESATAMLMSAMARGVRLGWLDRSFLPTVRRAWRALAAHVAEDGTIVDVCTSTGAGPTRRYYLDREAISGADDRGGAMALLAAVEMIELERKPSRQTRPRTQRIQSRRGSERAPRSMSELVFTTEDAEDTEVKSYRFQD